MVKRGGTKRKAVLKKIDDKNSKAVTFSKRREGLYSKAAQLCVMGEAQIAILATPSSSNSNVPFFSFGHSSVDSLVSAYLSGQRPVRVPEESKEMREDIGICMARKELGLGYWWKDEKLARSNDPEEIMQAMESMEILMRDAERLLDEDAFGFSQRKGSLVVPHHHGTGKTLIEVDDDDLLPQTLITSEDDQIISVCDRFFNDKDKNTALSATHSEVNSEEWSDMDIDQILNGFEEEEEDDHHHQIEAVSENSCSNKNNNALLLPGDDQNLLDLDLANVDLDTIFGGLATLDAELVASLLM
ncbi:agamous-like MADS-box protein AGL97 [Raphanus sativus]|uniref:Agamous-like MADS-box protein AGL97 n=1 Tax=Raphanus sativus TaxID=3726 RepID=A0A6J0KMJ6_RAPSA|nr:agamous-like MADS-box protein AGL97 [Raphanus sativus]XP_018448808.1 agamous-like MADS-box protein AGL97 [Raphanus sativus]KAJ4867622.1 agamous-like MADS-box protein AGL97 [Raphanus sativus]KAJ4881892.1 agamous-like MADS-box protein AGL97 [Raphanus sativus]